MRQLDGTARRERRGGISPGRVVAAAGALIVVLLIVTGGLAAIGFATKRTETRDLAFAAPAGRIVIESDRSGINLSAGGTAGRIEIAQRASWGLQRPHPGARMDGGVLRLDSGCPNWFVVYCDVTFEVRVPAGSAVRAHGNVGGISVDGITGDLDLAVETGGIKVDGAAGNLRLSTATGGIRVDGSRSADVTATANTGGVDLDFAAAPRRVEARANTGGVDVNVPGGERYRVDAGTSSGGTEVTVPVDPASAHIISAHANTGGVKVQAR